MPYFRRPKDHDHPYAQIANSMLEDEDLSFKAKGILAYLLSRSDNWKVYQAQLADLGPDGETAVRSGIEELMKLGYLERQPHRNEDGTIAEWVYIVHESPIDGAESRTGFSSTGSSNTGSSNIGESQPTNTDSNQNGKNQNGSDAHTHGEGDEEQDTSTEDRYEKLVEIWRETSGTPPLNPKREETFYRWADDKVITEWDTYRKVLRREAESTQERDVNLALAYLRESYEEEVASGKLSPKRQDDPNWTVEENEDGEMERHFKGVPLSEIGCKNYYTGETA